MVQTKAATRSYSSVYQALQRARSLEIAGQLGLRGRVGHEAGYDGHRDARAVVRGIVLSYGEPAVSSKNISSSCNKTQPWGKGRMEGPRAEFHHDSSSLETAKLD